MSPPNHRPAPDILDQATEALREVLRNAPVLPGPPDDLAAATVQAIEARHQAALPPAAVEPRRQGVLRYLRYGAAAAAAAILITVAGVLWFGGGTAVAFARVIENVQKAESVTFHETQKIGDHRELPLQHYLRGNRVRLEIADGATVVIVDTKERKALMLVPHFKTAQQLEGNQVNDLAGQTPIGALLGLKDQKPEAAGAETLDGKRTEVVRVTGGKWGGSVGNWRIWIDPRTELPVKIRFESTDTMPNVTKTFEKFSWNEKLDDSLFGLDVPAGYTRSVPGQKDGDKNKR
jgi:outer membrane lipoprotein-sorting protein